MLRRGLLVWLAVLLLLTVVVITANPARVAAQDPEPTPLVNDTVDVDLVPPPPPVGALDVGAQWGWAETSEFMVGSVAVGIIFPESSGAIDPSTEDWTPERIDGVLAEIQDALDWWAGLDPRANLSFVTEVYRGVPTSYEPISRPHTEKSLWMYEILKSLGHDYENYFGSMFMMANDLRDRHGTDWAFIIWVVDSYNDSDGCFSDGPFAFARRGGPYMVVTYDNDGWDHWRQDVVTAHEIGHIFYALDQYCDAHAFCTRTAGWLEVENQNSRAVNWTDCGTCLTSERSVMDFVFSLEEDGPLDAFARGQVGWWDLDGDNDPDSVDPDVRGSHLYECLALPDPTTATCRGLGIATGGVDHVQWRINGGAWVDGGAALDGAFDEEIEPLEFTFDVSGWEKGRYFVEMRVVDVNGVVQTAPPASAELSVLRPVGFFPLIMKDSGGDGPPTRP